MRQLRAFLLRLAGMFNRRQLDNELSAEMESHLQMHVEDNLRSGMSPEEARRWAVIQLGGVERVKESYRERRGLPALETVLQDVGYALRMLRKNPGFSAVAVLTLAVGISASTTIYSWIDSVLLHPLRGVERANELMAFETMTPGGDFVPTSYENYRDYRDYLKLLSGLAVTKPVVLNVGEDENIERVSGELVSGNYFAVLGVKPLRGRVFLPDEYGDKGNGYPIAVISERLWQKRYNSDPAVAGKTIRVNRQELTIVGVAPAEFGGTMVGWSRDIWVPYVMQPQLVGVGQWMLRDRKTRNLLGLARLRPGVTVNQANAEIAALARRMGEAQPYEDGGMSGILLPIWKSHFGPQELLLSPLRILMSVCVLVLLIGCANVANLLLARSTSRQKEFSIRMALGAKRGRLARQVLTESLVLAAAAGIASLGMATWMSKSLQYLHPLTPGVQPSFDIRLSGPVMAFMVLVCLITSLVSGIAPAMQSMRVDLNASLKDGGRSGAAERQPQRLRSLLVISEVSLALVALIGAGLFVRSFQAARKIDPGFDPGKVLLTQFTLSSSGYSLREREQFCFRLREKMESAPGITAVAYSDGVPLGLEPSWWEDLKIEGYVPAPSENMKIYRNVISPGYFSLMRMPLVEGRDFSEKDDDDKQTQAVMIVNQTFVKRFLGQGNPIGRRVFGWGQWFTVVGVARDAKYHHLTEAPMPYVYYPFRQVYRADMYLAFYVRAAGDPNAAVSALRNAVHEIDPAVAIFDSAPLTEYMAASLYTQRIVASLLSVLGVLALLLAAVGLYSVMSYSVTQRTHEIGIRMALGAQRSNVLGMVLRRGLALTLIGVVVGTGVVLALARSVFGGSVLGSSLGQRVSLLGVSATDPLIYISAALFLLAIAALATYVPARRAVKVDPTIALRYE